MPEEVIFLDTEYMQKSSSNLKVLLAFLPSSFFASSAAAVYLATAGALMREEGMKELLFVIVLALGSLAFFIVAMIRSKSEVTIYRSHIKGLAGVEGHPIRLQPFDIEFKDIDFLDVNYRRIIFESGGVCYSVLCASHLEAEELHLSIFQLTENARVYGT